MFRPLLRLVALVAALAGATACAANPPASDLRVMTFNIRYGTAQDGENRWEVRRQLVFDVAHTFAPHVLGLQEALRFQLDEMGTALVKYGEVGVGRDDGREAGEYSPILYDSTRLIVVDEGTFWFSDTPETPGSASWGNRIPRICTWARFRDEEGGGTFTVYNVHWDHESQESRVRSAALLLERIGSLVLPGEPVLVTGDFNAGETNPAFQALVADDDVVLRDTFRAVAPVVTGVGTYHGFEGGTDGDKIDAILASTVWNVVSAEILRTSRDGRYPSDHYPVTAIVRLVR